MGAPRKQEVLDWLDEHGWAFRDMTDAEKLVMREHWNICGAATSTSKYTEPCTFTPMANGRCKKHGGKSLKGAAHPNAKTLEHSRYVPKPLEETYNQALKDSNLNDLRRQLALMQAREDILLQRTTSGETGKAWKALRQELGKLRQAVENEDGRASRDALTAITVLVNTGERDAEAWDELMGLWEQQRRSAETDAKIKRDLRLLMAIEDGLWAVRRLGEANETVILSWPTGQEFDEGEKRKLLGAILDQFAKLTGLGSDGAKNVTPALTEGKAA
jgi:hypothetical protein